MSFFPKLLLAGPLAGLLWLGMAVSGFGQTQESQPNMILIMADDMGYGDLSAVNGGKSRTPRLDHLMEQSVVFGQAYSASPVCAPARASLLTGRYPHRTGVIGLNSNKGVTELLPDEVTLANLFQDAGYATGLIGKWHSGALDYNHPTRRGFGSFEGFTGGANIPSYFYFRLDLHGDHIEADGGQAFRNVYLTDELSKRAIQFVRRNRDEPFFLKLSHYAPHRPLDAPEEKIQPYLAAGLHRDTATVYAMLEVMDQGIGDLLDVLDELSLAQRTLVIFTSDNGPDPMVRTRFNAGLSGTKYYVHEGGIRVPFFIRWPGVLEPGRTERLLHFIDLFPTLASAANLEKPSGVALDGVDLWGWLTGKKEEAEMPNRFWQWNRPNRPSYTAYSHNAAMRAGDWKLVRPYGVSGDSPWGIWRRFDAPSSRSPLLFNLRDDPNETTNLAARYPERTEEMLRELAAWSESVEAERIRKGRPDQTSEIVIKK